MFSFIFHLNMGSVVGPFMNVAKYEKLQQSDHGVSPLARSASGDVFGLSRIAISYLLIAPRSHVAHAAGGVWGRH